MSNEQFPPKRYTVYEIERMREALAEVRLFDRGFIGEVEDQLRTYMLNGTDPEELEALVPIAEEKARKARLP